MEEGLESKVYQKSALVMAYVGDSVFSTVVRERLASKYDFSAGELNSKANKIVCAKAQASMFQIIHPLLTERELDISFRSRNVSPKNIAKSSSLTEYIHATSLEAVLGYLYLSEQTSRLKEIVDIALEGKI